MKAEIDFNPQDLWIGCFWRKHPKPNKIYLGGLRISLELWICLIPTLPIHLMFGKRVSKAQQ
jgi:hypothetical protein